MSKNDTTMVITSCNRPRLLRRTLKSIRRLSLAGLKEVIIIEDAPKGRVAEIVPDDIKGIPVKFLQNERNIGLIPSVDRAYSHVKTPYIFHAEDDWHFPSSLFIEESKQILIEREDVTSVMIRDPAAIALDRFRRPLEETENKPKVRFWRYPEKSRDWGHFSFNPWLRRLADYQKLGRYSEHFTSEKQISLYYRKEKMRLAYLLKGDVEHIGKRHSTKRAGAPSKPQTLSGE